MTAAERRSERDPEGATLRDHAHPPRARRRHRTALCAVALLASLAACVSSTPKSEPSSSPSFQAKIVPMGTKVETAAGNTVVAYSFVSPVGKAPSADKLYVAADLQACGGANASRAPTGVQRTLFGVETPDGTVWQSVGAVKNPGLKPALLRPNTCARGWVTFLVPKAPKPLYVVFFSTTLVKWKIP